MPPLQEPSGLGPLLQELTGAARQAGEQGQRQALAGLAIGPGLGRAWGFAVGAQQDGEGGHGGAAGVVGAEDLSEGGPEGDAGGEDAVSPVDPLLHQGLGDQGGVEEAIEGLGGVVSEGIEVATELGSVSLWYRRPPRRRARSRQQPELNAGEAADLDHLAPKGFEASGSAIPPRLKGIADRPALQAMNWDEK